MSKFNSRQSVFAVQDTVGSGSLPNRDISTYLSSVDGLPGEVERPETTALGDRGRRHHRGLENVTITIEGFFDDADDGIDEILAGLRGDDAERPFKFAPNGLGPGGSAPDILPFANATYRSSANGLIVYSGRFKLRNYMITSRVGETVTFRAELLVQGVVTRDSSPTLL